MCLTRSPQRSRDRPNHRGLGIDSVNDAESQCPAGDLRCDDIAWFVARSESRPSGVVRVFYDPPLAACAQYQYSLLDSAISVVDFIAANRLAEIGRFAVDRAIAATLRS